jgi:hypothetical protein
MPDEPAKAIGKMSPRTDADLERLSEVDETALERGRSLWRRVAAERWKGLVDARPHDQGGGSA